MLQKLSNCFQIQVTQVLSAHNYLFAAVFWTIAITALSLGSFSVNTLETIPITHEDKVVHFLFYFVFVFLWTGSFSEKTRKKTAIIVVIAIFYGILMEFFQAVFTTTRQADIFDVLANSLGAFFGAWAVRKFHFGKK